MDGSAYPGCNNAVANAARSYKSTAAAGTIVSDTIRFCTSGQPAVMLYYRPFTALSASGGYDAPADGIKAP
jgi:hypothetical protein